MTGNYISQQELAQKTNTDESAIVTWAMQGVFPDAVYLDNIKKFVFPRKYVLLLLNNKVKPPGHITEAELERKIVRDLREDGHDIVKIQGMGTKGWPDRLALLNNGKCFFAEIKTELGVVSPHQQRKHERIKNLNHKVFVISTFKEYQTIKKMFTNENNA